jgi:hypothetical protein
MAWVRWAENDLRDEFADVVEAFRRGESTDLPPGFAPHFKYIELLTKRKFEETIDGLKRVIYETRWLAFISIILAYPVGEMLKLIFGSSWMSLLVGDGFGLAHMLWSWGERTISHI